MDSPHLILLAEDDPHDVELTLRALTANNLANEMVVACDGMEALDYVYCRGNFEGRWPGHPVVILLNLKMPRVSGWQVLRTLKSDPSTCFIPIVALTSSGEDLDVAECYRLGANAYVVKPVRFVEFTETVRVIGAFWALINEPPPGSVKRAAVDRATASDRVISPS